jgi:hypothetical protein
LLANLRGEVGEVVLSWILLRFLMLQASTLRTGDPAEVSHSPQLFVLDALMEKLEDEIAARLSELAQSKIGRLNFHFAHKKLGVLEEDVEAFSSFIEQSRIKEKRDRYISHKDLPETWRESRYLQIDYPVLLKGIARALRLMKRFDAQYIGATSTLLWREMRKKRYDFSLPPRVGYMLLPYMRLSPEDMRTALENGG